MQFSVFIIYVDGRSAITLFVRNMKSICSKNCKRLDRLHHPSAD